MRTSKSNLVSRLGPCLLSAGLVPAVGCGEQEVNQQTIAQAVQTENQVDKAAAALEEKERAERKAKAEAERALEERRRQEIDAAASLPASMPADLAAACEAVVESYDLFMKAGSERDVLLWHDGRRGKLGERRAACIKMGGVKVAACQAEALRAELPSLEGLERTEAARRVAEHCLDKYGAS